ncbi:MAG TPA: hypothetical protein VF626_01930 [Chthoniobacterales bacterium]
MQDRGNQANSAAASNTYTAADNPSHPAGESPTDVTSHTFALAHGETVILA